MKLLIIGVGDCGCRLSREFVDLNRKAAVKRHTNIITRAYAVNTEEELLKSFNNSDIFHTVLVQGQPGDSSTEAGARLIKQESDRIMVAMRLGFFEADAFMFIAGTGGTLGSGGVPVLASMLKERYVDKPVYALMILPFASESQDARYVHNTAVCLNSVHKAVDAVIVVDNGGINTQVDRIPVDNIELINKGLTNLFYDLLCAGETVGPKSSSLNLLDAGDIVQTFSGWTSIGIGRANFSESGISFRRLAGFQEKGSETLKTMEAINSALTHLSIDCKLENSGKVLYLLSVPVNKANLDMVKTLGNRLRELAINAEMREGMFPSEKNAAMVTLVVSELVFVEKVKEYYEKASELAKSTRE